jgi:hypothetical protein
MSDLIEGHLLKLERALALAREALEEAEEARLAIRDALAGGRAPERAPT